MKESIDNRKKHIVKNPINPWWMPNESNFDGAEEYEDFLQSNSDMFGVSPDDFGNNN